MVTSSNAFLSTEMRRINDIKPSSASFVTDSKSVSFVIASMAQYHTTALQYKNGDNDDEEYLDSYAINSESSVNPDSSIGRSVDTIDLPKSFMQKSDTSREDLLSLENVIGRTAMVCFVLFFAKEFASNVSIADQISAVLRTFPH